MVLQVLVALHWIQDLKGVVANMMEVSTRKLAMTRSQWVENTLARGENTTSTGAMSTRTNSIWRGAPVYFFWALHELHLINAWHRQW